MKQRAIKIVNMIINCDAAMNRGVFVWRQEVANGNPEALEFLRRAARLPYRIQDRVQEAILTEGAPTINAWLADNNLPSLGTLATMLQPYLDYSDVLKDHYQIDGWTEEQIATDIENNREPIDPTEYPMSAGYVDDF